MRILGIDPGVARLGWGVVDVEKGKLRVVDYDCFETKSSEAMPTRLKKIYAALFEILNTLKPDALAVEELFFNTNAKTALIVGQARGIVLLAGAEHNLTVQSYTPLQVKMTLTGYGRAEKSQIGIMVKTLLGLKSVPKPDDTADALAVAITHALSYKMNQQL